LRKTHRPSLSLFKLKPFDRVFSSNYSPSPTPSPQVDLEKLYRYLDEEEEEVLSDLSPELSFVDSSQELTQIVPLVMTTQFTVPLLGDPTGGLFTQRLYCGGHGTSGAQGCQLSTPSPAFFGGYGLYFWCFFFGCSFRAQKE